MARELAEHHMETNALRRYELLSENTRDIVLFVRPDGAILEANRAAVTAYGYTRRELLSMHVLDLRATEALTEAREQLKEAFHSGITFETVHRRKDGSTFPVEVSSTPSQIGGLLLSLVRDITQRKQWEQTQSLLREVDQSILRREPVSITLKTLCKGLTAMLNCPLVWVSHKQANGTMIPRAWAGEASGFLQNLTLRWDDPAAATDCPTGAAIRTTQPQIVTVREAPDSPWRAAATAAGIRQACSIPLAAADETLGALSLYHRDEGRFDPETVRNLLSFAAQVSVSLLFARDQEQIRLRTAALEAAANGMVITDRDGAILWVNPAWCRLTGYSAAEAFGQNPRILKSGVHSGPFYKHLWDTILSGRIWAGEVYNRRKDGTIYPEEMTITPIRSAEGEITHFVAVKQDMTERKRREEELRYLSLHDPVTKLPNRRALQESLDHMVGDVQDGKPGVLMLMDVDDFKRVNEALGQTAGDTLLAHIARVLRGVLRPHALVARWGGDEFAALVEGSSLEEAVMLADEVRRAVQQDTVLRADHELPVGISIGIAAVDGTLSQEAVISLADRALFQAKEEGGNHVAVGRSQEERFSQAEESARWATRIRDALKTGKLVLLLQPVVGLKGGQVDHYEALIHFRLDDGSLAPARLFMPAAERFGLRPDLDRWAIGRVLALLQEQPTLKLFLSLSAPSLRDGTLLDTVVESVRTASGIAGRFGLSIAEAAAAQDLQTAQTWIQRLMPLGCRFALDDFGFGFASFTYLKALPVEMVKLTPALVNNLDTDPTDLPLVRAVADMAHALGKSLAATRVERESVAAALREIGVEWGQGALWGLPGERPASMD